MGLAVFNQVDEKQYFSISRIDKERMKEYGLNMSIKQLKAKARKTVPAFEIPTGDADNPKRQAMTKIYRYADFCEVKND